VLDSAGGAGAANVVVVAMDGEMGSPNAATFMTEWMVAGSKKVVMIVIQSDLGSGLRRPDEGETGERACGGVSYSHGGDGRVMKERLCSFMKHS
jgi:hypothetical protein